MLITISEFFQKTWIVLVLGVIGGVSLIKRYLKTKTGKKAFDRLLLKIPVICNVVRISSLVDATRTLSVLIASGVSILDSLNIVVDTAGNIVYKEAFEQVYKNVEKGQSLGGSLEMAEVFPPVCVL
jgi:type II secretory pathway component PulF